MERLNEDVVVDLDDGKDDLAPALKKADVDETDDAILPSGCEKNEDGSVTVNLLYPKTVTIRSNGAVKEELYERLTFHRMTGKDLNAIRAASDATATVVTFQRLTRIRPSVMSVLFDRLDAKDVTRCGAVINTFL